MAVPAFCPHCGHEVRDLGRSTGRCTGCGREVYANSRPTAGVFLVRDGQVLLIRRAAPPAAGRWDIPGGFLEEGEPPEEGACREIREELGVELEPADLRLVLAAANRWGEIAVLEVLFEAEMPEQEPRAGSDAAGYGWFAIDDLPADLAFEATAGLLERWRAARGRGG